MTVLLEFLVKLPLFIVATVLLYCDIVVKNVKFVFFSKEVRGEKFIYLKKKMETNLQYKNTDVCRPKGS